MIRAELDQWWQPAVRGIEPVEMTKALGPLPCGLSEQARRVIATLDDGVESRSGQADMADWFRFFAGPRHTIGF